MTFIGNSSWGRLCLLAMFGLAFKDSAQGFQLSVFTKAVPLGQGKFT